MLIETAHDYAEMSAIGASVIFADAMAKLAKGERYNLGLATGNTMITLYEELADKFNHARADLSLLSTWNLDEYATGCDHRPRQEAEADKGMESPSIVNLQPPTSTLSPRPSTYSPVPHDHPLSYWKYMHEKLFSKFDPALGFREENAHFPDPADPAKYDPAIAAAGGLDLQLLGIGFNGHIAFNEPMQEGEITVEAFGGLPTRVLPLSDETIVQNTHVTANGDSSLVPRYAATMGMAPILAARKCLLLACFAEQQAPLRAIFAKGAPTPFLPASYLWRHPDYRLVYTTDKIAL